MIYPDYFTQQDIQNFEQEYNAFVDQERSVAEKQQLVAVEVSEEIYSPYWGA